MFNRRPDAHQKRITYLLLTVLTILVAACQNHTTATITEQWFPPYLQLQLYDGKAQVQWADDSDWTVVDGDACLTVEETLQIIADATEGAQFHLGDGSTLELTPGTIIEMRNPHTFPRLQVTLQEGNLLLVAQKPSYELIVPTCSVTLLSLPTRIRVEAKDETTHLAVEEGAVVCTMETGTLTLPKCQEMYARSGEEPETTEFCDAGATATVSAMTPSPTFDFREHDVTTTAATIVTATVTATPSPIAIPTREAVTQTPTPIPPTDTPLPPPPPPKNTPRPTQPPPPPTNTPPPPTNIPPPPPTDTPPPPTNTPPRATPTQPRPTEPPPTTEPPPPTEPPTTEATSES